MTKFYSAERRGFFDDQIHRELPADAVPISDDRHRELLEAQKDGRSIEADKSGRPTARKPRLSIAEQRSRAVRKVKREAARRIDEDAPVWRQLNAMRSEGGASHPMFAHIDAIRTASAEIEAAIGALGASELAALNIAGDPRWPSLVLPY